MSKGMKITIGVFAGIFVIAIALTAGLVVVNAAHRILIPKISQMMGWGYNNRYSENSMMGKYGQSVNNAMTNSTQVNSPFGPSFNATPLTIDQARQAASGFLSQINDPNLEIREIMVFTNNAYVRVVEKDTGIGAMELLVDSTTQAVIPEYGPNMMWNLKYSPMHGGGYGNYGGMMGRADSGMMDGYNQGNGNWQVTPPVVSSEMAVSPDQAVLLAQHYLDSQYPGYQADPDPDQFYGYFTIDILNDGKPAGMLSVNGFSGQVFLHTWHGTFITASGG